MNKFKLYHPLLMAGFYLGILLLFGYVDFIMRNPNYAIVSVLGVNIHLFFIIAAIGCIGLITFFIIYTYLYVKYDKENIGSLRPPEINDEDEGTQLIYHKATKRIYMFYAVIIPVLALGALFLHFISFEIQMNMLVYVFFSLLVVHYLIYYKVVAEFVK